jgi:hypothetical protein
VKEAQDGDNVAIHAIDRDERRFGYHKLAHAFARRRSARERELNERANAPLHSLSNAIRCVRIVPAQARNLSIKRTFSGGAPNDPHLAV